jgi:hypothetical protein
MMKLQWFKGEVFGGVHDIQLPQDRDQLLSFMKSEIKRGSPLTVVNFFTSLRTLSFPRSSNFTNVIINLPIACTGLWCNSLCLCILQWPLLSYGNLRSIRYIKMSGDDSSKCNVLRMSLYAV